LIEDLSLLVLIFFVNGLYLLAEIKFLCLKRQDMMACVCEKAKTKNLQKKEFIESTPKQKYPYFSRLNIKPISALSIPKFKK
jgi:high-affinity Fe2+/Pb2+ permease